MSFNTKNKRYDGSFICEPTPAKMMLFAVKLILSYEQKCKVRSKFLKNESMLKNKLWHKFYEFINSN